MYVRKNPGHSVQKIICALVQVPQIQRNLLMIGEAETPLPSTDTISTAGSDLSRDASEFGDCGASLALHRKVLKVASRACEREPTSSV